MTPRTAIVLAGLLAALATSASAKPPALDRVFPAGARVGQTLAVTAEGTFERWPVRVWTEDPDLKVTPEKEKGALTVVVAADARPGVHWLRLYDDEGASALKPFFVGTLPEITEDASRKGPQVLETTRVTVNGRLAKAGEVDEFSVPLKRGQTLLASVEANRRLASPMDGVLQVAAPEGFVLAQNDDDRGFDPELAFEAPADGTYLVRLFAFPATPNSTIAFAGDKSYVYRLTLTTGGFLRYPYPLAVSRATNPATVEAHGWNLPEEARQLAITPNGGEDPSESETVAVAHPSLANTVDVGLVSHASVVEREPNDPSHPQAVEWPLTVSGRISPKGDRDIFEFVAKKGQPVSIRVESRGLGSPLDPILRLTDAAGKTLNEVDDRRKDADPELTFSPPADGTYRVLVRDLNDEGGDDFVYRLDLTAPSPDFRLSLAEDRFTLEPGKPLSLPVNIQRRDGFNRPIEVRLEGFPAGVEATSVRSEPTGDTSRTVSLTLTSKGPSPASSPIRVIGKAVDGPFLEHPAQLSADDADRMPTQAWLTVAKPVAGK